MKRHFRRLIFLPCKIQFIHVYRNTLMCIYVDEYMYISIHMKDLPSMLLRSQTRTKLDGCWVEDQWFLQKQTKSSSPSDRLFAGVYVGSHFLSFSSMWRSKLQTRQIPAHKRSCFPSGVALRLNPTSADPERGSGYNSGLCVQEPSERLFRTGLRLEGSSSWLKEMPCCWCRHKKTLLWQKNRRYFSSSTFTARRRAFHRTLRSIWCSAACNGKGCSSDLRGHLSHSASKHHLTDAYLQTEALLEFDF